LRKRSVYFKRFPSQHEYVPHLALRNENIIIFKSVLRTLLEKERRVGGLPGGISSHRGQGELRYHRDLYMRAALGVTPSFLIAVGVLCGLPLWTVPDPIQLPLCMM
jgi:hypothetical protein